MILQASCDIHTGGAPATWQKRFGGNESEYGYDIQQTSEGGYIIAGMTGSRGDDNGDIYLLKIEGKGNEQWSGTFGGRKTDWAKSVRQTADDGYIIAGTTFSYQSEGGDVFIIKTDGDGNTSLMEE